MAPLGMFMVQMMGVAIGTKASDLSFRLALQGLQFAALAV